MLEVGRIAKPHGVRGDVIVALVTDRLERVAPGAVLDADGRRLVVESSTPHQGHHIVHFEGLFDRTGAEALQGKVLHAEPIDDPDELWAHELLGKRVVDLAGVERGTIVSVQDNPASDLLVLDNGALVPVLFVVEQRADALVIDPPEGLFDL
ncbi:MAG: rRNA processing protein RimM [Acidimicrobiaceae bacterium]